MGKRQRARMRATQPFASPLLNEYAQHLRRSVLDGGASVAYEELQAAHAEAVRHSARFAAPTATPTPEEMLMRSALDASRMQLALHQKVWRLRDGKEGQIFDVKFDADGFPTYRITTQTGLRSRHHASMVFEVWSPTRVYFPVDLETGRPILTVANPYPAPEVA